MGTNPQKQIALSLKARGLTVTPAIPRTRQLLLQSLGQSVVDISIAICVQIVLLSWSAWISVLLVILCVVFYANYQDGGMAASEGSIMIPIALLVYLPCLGLVYMVSTCNRLACIVDTHCLSGPTGCEAVGRQPSVVPVCDGDWCVALSCRACGH